MSQTADNIKLIRKVSKLTQTAFGAVVGLTKDKVYTYENGVTEPDDFAIARIAKIARLTTDDVKGRALKEDEIKIQLPKKETPAVAGAEERLSNKDEELIASLKETIELLKKEVANYDALKGSLLKVLTNDGSAEQRVQIALMLLGHNEAVFVRDYSRKK